jgi:hypothetical protein
MAVYSVMFPGEAQTPLERVRLEDLRLELAARAIELIASDDEAPLIAFPAGMLCARSEAQRDHLAEHLAKAAQREGVGLLFGIDVIEEDGWAPLRRRPRSFAFACARGLRLLWATEAQREREPPLGDERVFSVTGRQVALLVEGETFSPSARALVERRRPELIVALTHAGATPRWTPALAALERLAPVLVVRHALPRRSAWAQVPRGWARMQMGADGLLTIERFSPEPFGAALQSVGN